MWFFPLKIKKRENFCAVLISFIVFHKYFHCTAQYNAMALQNSMNLSFENVIQMNVCRYRQNQYLFEPSTLWNNFFALSQKHQKDFEKKWYSGWKMKYEMILFDPLYVDGKMSAGNLYYNVNIPGQFFSIYPFNSSRHSTWIFVDPKINGCGEV